MFRTASAIAIVVVAMAAAGCNQPVKLQFASPPPERATTRGPLKMPAVQAVNADGVVVTDVKITMTAEPAGVIVDSPEGLSIANRGDVTLTYTTDKKLLLAHPLRVLLPTRVELRCLPSCFGTIGGESKLETLVYSEGDLLADMKAPCESSNPAVVKVEGETMKFVDKGEALITCRIEDAFVNKKVDVAPPSPPEPAMGADGAVVPATP